MANYTDKNAGDPWLAADGNALADDIGNPSTGHQHDGVEGHGTILPNAIGDGASITWDGRLLLDKGADLASGSTVTPGVDGNFFDITGTTTITAIATLQAGTVVIFQFDDAVQITHHATSLILEGGVNRTTEAKDIMMFLSLGSGNWQEISRSLVTPAVTHTIASHSDTTATGAETDTLTDGSDASSLHNHTVANLNDTGATGTELDTLTDGSDRDGLHTHPVYAKVASGTYTGDGAVSQAITGIGFQVVAVWIWHTQTGDGVTYTTGEFMMTHTALINNNANGYATDMSNAITEGVDNAIIALGADGFTVDDDGVNEDPNISSIVYEFLAFG